MKKVIQWSSIVIGILIALLIVAAILLKVLVNPNDYKDKIAQSVLEQTGRQLQINGAVKLSFFPWLGVDIKGISLGNPPGFKQKTFVSIDEAQIRLHIAPLLIGHINVGTLQLIGLNTQLIMNDNGQSNWQFQPPSKKTTPTSTRHSSQKNSPATRKHKKSTSTLPIAVDNLRIKNAAISLQNLRTGEHWQISNANLSSHDINLDGKPFSFNAQLRYQQSTPLIDAQFKLSSHIAFNTNQQHWQIKDGQITLILNSFHQPLQKPLDLTLKLDDLVKSAQSFEMQGAKLNLGQGQIHATLSGSVKPTVRDLNGQLAIKNLNPQTLLRLSNKANSMAGIKAINAQIKLRSSGDITTIKPLTIKINQSTINGQANYSAKHQRITFQLGAKSINLDQWLAQKDPAKAKQTQTSSKESSPTKDQTVIQSASHSQTTPPALNWQGRVDIQKLIIKKLALRQVHLTTQQEKGQLSLNPVTALLYHGRINANYQLALNKAGQPFNLGLSIVNLPIGQVIKASSGHTSLTGTANFSTKLASHGASKKQITQNLGGQGQLTISNGQLAGVNLDALVKQANDFLTHHKLSKSDPKASDNTRFSQLGCQYRIKNGIAYNNIYITTPLARASGNGYINLNNEAIHYELSVGPAKKNSWQFPLIVSGTLESPKYAPNIAAIAGEMIKSLVGDALEKAFGGDKKKSDRSQQESQKKIQQFFKGLFH